MTIHDIAEKIVTIYNRYLQKKEEENERTLTFHASSAGQCFRKNLYQKHPDFEPKPLNNRTLRIFQLGNLVHKDLQEAAYGLIDQIESISEVLVEYPIEIQELGIEGTLDLAFIGIETLYVFDIKTANEWSYRKAKKTPEEYRRYWLQVATYGLGLQREYPDHHSIQMGLLFYNKNRSTLNFQEIPQEALTEAYGYWETLQEMTLDNTLPGEDGVPFDPSWECKYCDYNHICPTPYDTK